MKKVILHIGSHKTGTSSIQASIENYNFNRTKTLNSFGQNHSIGFYTIFSKDFFNYHIWKNEGLSKDQIIEKKQNFLDKLNEQLNDQAVDTLIISGEDISVLEPDEKISLINFFTSKKLELKIIYFIRNPMHFCISSMQETIKNGRKNFERFLSLPSHNYSKIKPFLKNLPEGSVHVYNFDESIKKHGDITKAFASYLNLSNLPRIRINESLNEIPLKILYRLNNIPFNTLGDSKKFETRKKFTNELIKFFSNKYHDNINKKIFLESLNIDIDENENNFLQKYNIDTNSNKLNKNNFNNIFNYLDEFNTEDRKEFNKFCRQFIITDIIEELSLNTLILCLYLKFLSTDENDYINSLRNQALFFEKSNYNLHKIYCYELMLVASIFRPKGQLILKKLAVYKNHI